MNENTYKLMAAAFLCTTIAAGGLAFYYNYQLGTLQADYDTVLEELADFTAVVDIMIDYGDGNIVWYNDTRIQTGASVLDATILACETEYQTSDFGSYVTSIDGVAQDGSNFWLWSFYDDSWESGAVGADQYYLHDGDIIGWTYTFF